ncbi:hypothetical protein CAPN008_20530 [Capnocytophaga canis]|uniref:hypothetical protein n=1 Tax=Capnocytophaga canis TaxID=1848903 RepID=UPI001AD3910A|nr:hypothetical protein [Capnocytophaga canis]GIM62003.1 hypothetical protein CAPN008_20530 [Capnocytophaga canis]
MAKEKNTENIVAEQETTFTIEALQAKENELNEREATLLAREKEIQQEQEELQKKEAELQEKEAELTQREKALNIPQEVEKTEPQKGLEFSFRENKYKFTDDAPKIILFEGEARSQESLSKDEDALIALIGGNSSLIEKI